VIGFSLTALLLVATLGMPIALAILGSTLLYYSMNKSLPTELVFQAFITGIESFPMLSIPLFIMAGELMNSAGMTRRLVRFADTLVGHFVGGLAQVNVLTNAFLGGLSGSANADAAAISKTLVPEMEKRGYSRDWSSALTAAGSVMGPIIPPGIGLILYGMLADVSIGKLFIGAIIPGLLLCVSLMITVRLMAARRGFRPDRTRATFREVWEAFKGAIWALMLPVLIIGGIRFGVFTHTEAAAMAVVYALAVGIVNRELKFRRLVHAFADTVRITAVIMFIVAAANSFGRMLSWERIPHAAAEFMASLSTNPYIILLMINAVLLILGCFMEGTANLIIMTPLLMPVILNLGIDPLAFGVVIVLNLTIGGITPPFGTVMFTVCTLNRVTLWDYSKQIWPFVITVIIVLLVVTYVPPLTTFLPNLLMN